MDVTKEGVTIHLNRWEANILSNILEVARVAELHTSRGEPVDVRYILNEVSKEQRQGILLSMFNALE